MSTYVDDQDYIHEHIYIISNIQRFISYIPHQDKTDILPSKTKYIYKQTTIIFLLQIKHTCPQYDDV